MGSPYPLVTNLNAEVANLKEMAQVGKVRRAKLYYLRALTGKKARIKEKRVNN